MESTLLNNQKIHEMNISLRDAFLNLKSFKNQLKGKAKLRGQHQLLARYIVKLFIEDWNSRNPEKRQKGFYLNSNHTSLSCLCDCSSRSIRNQLDRLIECGIILQTQRTRRGIQIWINPKSIIDFSALDRKDFQGLVLEPSVKEERTKNVDSLVTQRTDEKNTKEQHSTGSKPNTSWFLMSGPVCCSDLALNFWEHTKKYIYPELNFSEARDKVMVDLISEYYQRRISKEQLEPAIVHNEVLANLERARKWFKDHPKVNPPDPYHFFSIESSGFRFWKLWDFEQRKSKLKTIQLIRKRIRWDCFRQSTGQLHLNKFHLLKTHLSWIKSQGNKDLGTWFALNSHKLYSI